MINFLVTFKGTATPQFKIIHLNLPLFLSFLCDISFISLPSDLPISFPFLTFTVPLFPFFYLLFLFLFHLWILSFFTFTIFSYSLSPSFFPTSRSPSTYSPIPQHYCYCNSVSLLGFVKSLQYSTSTLLYSTVHCGKTSYPKGLSPSVSASNRSTQGIRTHVLLIGNQRAN
jgi:hypothetical protein